MVERVTGVVRWFSNSLGYGFVAPQNGGNDIFIHYSNISMKGYKTLREDQVVEFEIGTIEKNGKALSNALEVIVLAEGPTEPEEDAEHDEHDKHDEHNEEHTDDEDAEANS